jgi:hypothetical protein
VSRRDESPVATAGRERNRVPAPRATLARLGVGAFGRSDPRWPPIRASPPPYGALREPASAGGRGRSGAISVLVWDRSVQMIGGLPIARTRPTSQLRGPELGAGVEPGRNSPERPTTHQTLMPCSARGTQMPRRRLGE